MTDLGRDRKTPGGLEQERAPVIYRWDLDKTYLRTEFDTVRDLLRTAFESASSKKTVPGAAQLLRELRSEGAAGIFFLSGSPEQMRRRLEAKLRLDGVRWDAFTLKPSLQNLLRGRFGFLRDQVGYKLCALLLSRTGLVPETDEVLFGDDAEADAFIYSLYADLCAGRVDDAELFEVLRSARIHEQDAAEVMRLNKLLPRRDCCRRVFIHLDRRTDPEEFRPLGRRVVPFYNYFQPALVLVEMGLLPIAPALRVAEALVRESGFGADSLIATWDDLVRRGHVGKKAAHAMGEAQDRPLSPAVVAFARAVASRTETWNEPPAIEPVDVEYAGRYALDRARARAAKKRATRS